MQNFYEGCGLDAAICGALEVGYSGQVNVMRIEDKLFGIGGFNNTTQTAKKVFFCFSFLDKNGKCKIKDKIEYINFNPQYSCAEKIYYITDRAVFQLIDSELKLIDYNEKYDLQKDIISYAERIKL